MENNLQNKTKKQWATPAVWILATANDEDMINNGLQQGTLEYHNAGGGGHTPNQPSGAYHS